MPEIGEIRKGIEVGYKGKLGKVIWSACCDCGKERWVDLYVRENRPKTKRCRSCFKLEFGRRARLKQKGLFGAANPCWKGGKYMDKHGYVMVKIPSTDFFFSMVGSNGYIREHRLVMAKYLGRCLQRWELVHHRNGVRDDNRLENLQLISDTRHNQITILENRIVFLEKRVTLLEAENIILKSQSDNQIRALIKEG